MQDVAQLSQFDDELYKVFLSHPFVICHFFTEFTTNCTMLTGDW
jgi:hypothetical protein